MKGLEVLVVFSVAVPSDSMVMKRLVPVAVPLAVPMVNMKAGRLWLVLVAVPLLVVVVAPMKSGVWMAPMGPVAPVGNMGGVILLLFPNRLFARHLNSLHARATQ